ncbi:PH domain-containing protein [Bhargavaea cecembensis]|uniref:PH domain-containing protein n=1 Tax=Bhargavaea cecembensis TaxID=394098 RepID=UPI0005911FE5|nr:PH domain-containing protein [Bhargavaea cecembensis]
MLETIQAPEGRISRKAVKVWRLTNFIEEAIALLIIAGLLVAGTHFGWWRWLITTFWVIGGISVVSAVYSIFIKPGLTQKFWRYGADEEFVKLRSGIWIISEQTIPMTKVQVVNLKQGPLLRRYGLYSLEIGTMGSSHTIPALPEAEAREFRDRIAHLAKIREEED